MRFVYRHMAFLGQESIWAAAATECANDQGRFWDYHDKLLAEQNGREKGVFALANLERFAADLGLQREPFNACVESGRYEAQVRAETESGRRKGVTATPTLFANGQKLERAATYPELLQQLDRLLAIPATR